jgi:hypothetical protein
MSNSRKCAECGDEYSGHGNQKYCSSACYFWSCVDKSGGEDACWPWKGHLNKVSGYGSVNAYTAGERTYAHRHAYRLTIGDPGELWVLHRCDNRCCANPRHLFAGTPWDNWADAISKGRPMVSTPKLTTAEVLAIRRSSARVKDLVRQYPVTETTIRSILRGLSWRHISDDVPVAAE